MVPSSETFEMTPSVYRLFFLQVVPGRARGGSFRRKKNYIARKEFAYRMRTRRPTSAMPRPFLCCERAFCCSMVVMCRGGDLTCFDVMRSVAGSDEAILDLNKSLDRAAHSGILDPHCSYGFETLLVAQTIEAHWTHTACATWCGKTLIGSSCMPQRTQLVKTM